MDTSPIFGCSGCSTTGGRMSCPYHRPNAGSPVTQPLGATEERLRALESRLQYLESIIQQSGLWMHIPMGGFNR